jgi:predicted ATPase/class 3 adenylate cyclase
VICPSCGQENREGARFCGACAASLAPELACASCGALNPAGQKFCDACGHPFGAAAPLVPVGPDPTASQAAPSARLAPASYTPKHLAERILDSRAAIEGERKIVTVVFADIVDSVPLGERTDPEEMHALMDRCFQVILPEVHRFEGTINQFQGDGFMALFGAPIALEDAPRRACLAALAIQQAVEPIRQEVMQRHGVDLRWRIGIHSGPVVVGRIGDDLRMDYTAVGDTTNLAARLEKAAPPGGILISEATRRLVSGLFVTEDMGSQQFKGKTEPTHMHRVIAERELSRMEADAQAGLTPLCGREHELATLRTAFDNTREGRGQVVFLVGEAGIGKSRLLHEFRLRLEGEPHHFFLGLCISYGRARFQPIVDGLRRLAGIDDQADEATAIRLVEQMTQKMGRDLGWTLPFLRDLLSLPVGDSPTEKMDGITRRSETVKALNALFLAAAADRPVVVAIEDLHWIDAASEAFLAGLVDSVPASRIMVVLSYRPGYNQSFGDRSYFTRVAMQALSKDEMGAMAGAMLDGANLPDELWHLIAGKAEGNPLFIEEVTKSLIEDGSLRVEAGQVALARKLDDIAIPDRIHDVLMARIDRLEDAPKRAIQIASVIGREFAMRLLQRLIEAGDAADSVVRELRALELIYEKSGHPELAFMFKHALTHDVAYQSVLVRRRKTLHGIVGRAIVELYRDRLAEHYEKLAHHFELAEEWNEALEYHLLSARKATRTYANQAAAEHCRRALEIAGEMDAPPPAHTLYELESQLGACCFALSEFRPSGEALRRAAEHAPNPPEQAKCLARAAYSSMWAHDYATSEELALESHALAREHDATGAESMATACDDHYGAIRGDNFDMTLIARAVQLAEQANDPEALVVALTMEVGRYERSGNFMAAIASAERAIALANRAHMGHMSAFATWFLAISKACTGQYGDALTSLGEALQTCERIGDQAVRPRLLNTLGWCYAEVDCHERAVEYNLLSTALAKEMVEQEWVAAAPELYANGSINLAGNRLELGDVDGARRALEPIEDQMTTDDDPWMKWRYTLHLQDVQARIALAQGDLDRALRLTGREIEGARNSQSKKLLARAFELRGRTLVLTGQLDEAEAALAEAGKLAEDIQYPPVRWRTLAVQGELARRRGDRTEAERCSIQTRTLTGKLAEVLPVPELKRSLSSLGERLATDPLSAHR